MEWAASRTPFHCRAEDCYERARARILMVTSQADHHPAPDIESAYAWRRLGIVLTIATIGGVGMWSVVVALPAMQTEFGIDRADASLPYTAVMLGFGTGGIVMGRLVDR